MQEFALPLVGKRAVVREAVIGDLEAWYQLEADQDAKRYLGGPVKRSKEEWIAGARRLIERDELLTWVVAPKTTGAFAGRVRLVSYHPDFEIQVVIAKAHWGERLGKEASELLIQAAFDLPGTTAVKAVIHPDNHRSKTLFRKLGFKSIGRKKTGEWDDDHFIYCLRRSAGEMRSETIEIDLKI
jgi:ribosomal-protein-alanine N-acetyltransferase